MNEDSSRGRGSSAQEIADQLAAEFEPLPAGTRLPSQRALVARFRASATTVAQSLVLLTQAGLVDSRPGAGSFRLAASPSPPQGDWAWQEAALNLDENDGTSVPRRALGAALADAMRDHGPDTLDLSGGYLHPQLQPLRLLTTSMSRVAKRHDVWARPASVGLPALRDWFANGIGGGLSRRDILIAPGGQAALSTTVRALTQPGDAVVVESPTYPGIIAATQSAALRPVSVPVDLHGIRPDFLDEALSRTRARVVIVQPLHQNPSGATMTLERQEEIRTVARQHAAFVIEDDFSRMLTHAGSPAQPPPMITNDPAGTVVLIRSLTKCTSPNVRVAAIAARGPAAQRIKASLTVDTLVVPAVLQHAVMELVTSPGWRGALRDLQGHLEERCQMVVAAFTRELGGDVIDVRPLGGYHLWIRLPPGTESAAVARRALAHGVSVAAGAHYHLTGQEHRPHLRVSYVATPSPADLVEGTQRLIEAITASRD